MTGGHVLIPGRLLILAPACFVCAGCSIIMAMSGTPEPNFDAFQVGSTRAQVEDQLRTPVSSQVLPDDKRLYIYQYQMGNAPNGHRALMNLYIDVYTLGIWELPATIIEAMMGHQEESRIIYGPDDRVLEIHGYRPPPLSPVELQAIEAQKQTHRPGLRQDSSGAGAAR
jgi:hypothetical protein